MDANMTPAEKKCNMQGRLRAHPMPAKGSASRAQGCVLRKTNAVCKGSAHNMWRESSYRVFVDANLTLVDKGCNMQTFACTFYTGLRIMKNECSMQGQRAYHVTRVELQSVRGCKPDSHRQEMQHANVCAHILRHESTYRALWSRAERPEQEDVEEARLRRN